MVQNKNGQKGGKEGGREGGGARGFYWKLMVMMCSLVFWASSTHAEQSFPRNALSRVTVAQGTAAATGIDETP